MLKAILFDIDGTLVDSNNFHVLAWAEALQAAGHEFRLAQDPRPGRPGRRQFRAGACSPMPRRRVEALGKAHAKLFARVFMHRLEPFPGARALLGAAMTRG